MPEYLDYKERLFLIVLVASYACNIVPNHPMNLTSKTPMKRIVKPIISISFKGHTDFLEI